MILDNFTSHKRVCQMCQGFFSMRPDEVTHPSHFNQRKFCSKNCATKYISQKKTEARKSQARVCIVCGVSFIRSPAGGIKAFNIRKLCSRTCQYKYQSEILRGKPNKISKTGLKNISKANTGRGNGMYVHGQRAKKVKGKRIYFLTRAHAKACRDYKQKIFNEYDYLPCELSNWEVPCSLIQMETHHIIYASEAPKHPNLHNEKNLILVCRKHHVYLHSKKDRRAKLVAERGLINLFPDIL